MRLINFLTVITFIVSCASHAEISQSQQQVAAFYQCYLKNFSDAPDYDSVQLKYHIAKRTLCRLKEIYAIPEQEILGSDYFTYTQDYDSHWISKLKVGDFKDYMGGKVGNISLGVDNNKRLLLQVYLIKEDNRWKIVRVKDITHHFESPIFDGEKILQAKNAS